LEVPPLLLRNPVRVRRRSRPCRYPVASTAVVASYCAVPFERRSNRQCNAWRTHQVLRQWLGSAELLDLTCQVLRNVVAKEPNVAIGPSPHEESGRTTTTAPRSTKGDDSSLRIAIEESRDVDPHQPLV